MICQAAQIRHANANAVLLAEENAADTAIICSADDLCNAESMTTSQLVFCQAAATDAFAVSLQSIQVWFP